MLLDGGVLLARDAELVRHEVQLLALRILHHAVGIDDVEHVRQHVELEVRGGDGREPRANVRRLVRREHAVDVAFRLGRDLGGLAHAIHDGDLLRRGAAISRGDGRQDQEVRSTDGLGVLGEVGVVGHGGWWVRAESDERANDAAAG